MKNSYLIILNGVLIGCICLLAIGIYINQRTSYTDTKIGQNFSLGGNPNLESSSSASIQAMAGPLKESQYVTPKKLTSGWVEDDADGDTIPDRFAYSGSRYGRDAEIKFYNTTSKEKKFDYLLLQYNSEKQPIAKERVEYLLKPNKQIVKNFKLVEGASGIGVEHGSTEYIDGWQDSLYDEELVGKEPKGTFQPWTTSSFSSKSCYVWMANEGNPKNLTIRLDHLDKSKDGSIIKTDTYTYKLDYNRQIRREFPSVKGEGFCRVTSFADDWDDTLYQKALVGKEPDDSESVRASSSGGSESCAIWIANTGKPKRIAIKILHQDKDGSILKTDDYSYELGYNRQITRHFPKVDREESCRVEAKVM